MLVTTLKISQEEMDKALEPLLAGTQSVEAWLQNQKSESKKDSQK